MTILDWTVVALYLLAMLAMALWLARSQHNREDYYAGGHRTGAWPIALSTMATQCSTSSLLGAPAFVAFSAGGGLVWLQYELALPLAMIPVMLFLLPTFRRLGLISVYHYLELRFGTTTRIVLSSLFQLIRAFATGVIVYATALVLEKLLAIPFWAAVLLFGAVTVVYDVIGGIRAVIYSDVVQMSILFLLILLMFFIAMDAVGGWQQMWQLFPDHRRQTLNLTGNGLTDGTDFAFWPMMVGGLLLYVAYYGCDQSQVQRELSSKDVDTTNMALFLNGLLRFPLVLSYCLLGVAIGAYATAHPEFIELLPGHQVMVNDELRESPNYTLAVPVFILEHFPAGLVGLAFVALFAAAMSSLDSVINSLSAATMEDLLRRFWPQRVTPQRELLYSRLLTLFWGAVTMSAAFFVGSISDSVLVSINKISSMINGPILGVFLLGVLTHRTTEAGVLVGLAAGFATNLTIALLLPQVSWLWWNASGLLATAAGGLFASSLQPMRPTSRPELVWSADTRSWLGVQRNWNRYYLILLLWSFGMLLLLVLLPGITARY